MTHPTPLVLVAGALLAVLWAAQGPALVRARQHEPQVAPTKGSDNNKRPPEQPEPCAVVRCGYGAHCRLVNGRARCQCPECRPDEPAQPVCGTDGATYSNECELRRLGCEAKTSLNVQHAGPCDCPVHDVQPNPNKSCPDACIALYEPVCGSNGQTYSNQCQLAIAACKGEPVVKAHDGECPSQQDCDQMCTADYAPVCGTNGKTYSNQCQLDIAACKGEQVSKAHEGECKQTNCNGVCPTIYRPVCGSDGNTYSNECQLNVAVCKGGVSKVSDGLCRKQCPQACLLNYAPVCGTDGKTYSNKCYLAMAACQQGKLIDVMQEGECPTKRAPIVFKHRTKRAPCAEFCAEVYEPVCGSDGQTYGNSCKLKRAACQKNLPIELVHVGKC